jgi:hypothetical protein
MGTSLKIAINVGLSRKGPWRLARTLSTHTGMTHQWLKDHRFNICQRAVGEHSLPGYGPVDSVKRPVRTRMRGVVEAGGKRPPATRLEMLDYYI